MKAIAQWTAGILPAGLCCIVQMSDKRCIPKLLEAAGRGVHAASRLACATRLSLLEPLSGRSLKQAEARAPSNHFGMHGLTNAGIRSGLCRQDAGNTLRAGSPRF